ncbi:MAG TPA: hypothetical protein DCX95_03015 [Elusimicrobia bacterium]|nr:hypothetical protein [Elusimicrobiota bacterium]
MERGMAEFWMCLAAMFLMAISVEFIKRGLKKLNIFKWFFIVIIPVMMLYIAGDLYFYHSLTYPIGRFSIDNFSIIMSIGIFVFAVIYLFHISYELFAYYNLINSPKRTNDGI